MFNSRHWFFSNIRRGESHPRAKLKNDDVRMIRKLFEQGFSIGVIAKNYNISKWNVKSIIEKQTWHHIE